MNLKTTTLALSLLSLSLPVFAGTAQCGDDPEHPKKYYQYCTSPYVFNAEDPEHGTDIPCTMPGQRDHVQAKTNLTDSKDSTPYLVYYAIDTKEPFMRTTVDFELKKLRQACANKKNNVHWVAFVNSLFTGEVTGKKYQFLYCGDRNDHGYEVDENLSRDRFQVLTLKPKQVETFKIKQFFIENGLLGIDGEDVEISFHTRYGSLVNKAFSRVPLAHPDFFHDLFTIARDDLFVQDDKEFTPFVHIKSHGSKFSLMTGLTEEQEDNKNSCQNSVMNNPDPSKNLIMAQWWEQVQKDGVGLGPIKLNKFLVSPFTKVQNDLELDEDFYLDCEATANAGKCQDVDTFGLPSRVLGDGGVVLGEGGVVLGEGGVVLGEGGVVLGEGGVVLGDGGVVLGDGGVVLGDGGVVLGEGGIHLNVAGNSLGDIGTSLGVDDFNLGIKNSFGTPYLKMNQLLTKLTLADENSKDIGFIMFESCESTVSSKTTIFEFTKLNLPKVKGFYSAEGSLWYRNMNWHYFLVKANGNAGKLQEIVIKASANISNNCIANEDGTACAEE